jgi:hypothetical protein
MPRGTPLVRGEIRPVFRPERGDGYRADNPPGSGDVEGRRRRRLSRWNLTDTAKAADYHFKVADTCAEVEAALRVVYTCYREFGLIPPRASGIRVTFHHVLPHTRVLVAKKSDVVHSTLTMVPDGRSGLPMDHEFSDVLAPLREGDAKLAEITSLATLPEYRQANLFMYLYKLLLLIGRQNGLTDFVLVINPKHVRFYRDILLFEQVGPERPYHAVSGAPGVPFRMNIERTLAEGHRVYRSGDVQQNLYEFFASPWESGGVAMPRGRSCRRGTPCHLFREILLSMGRDELTALSMLYRDAGLDRDWQCLLEHAGMNS